MMAQAKAAAANKEENKKAKAKADAMAAKKAAACKPEAKAAPAKPTLIKLCCKAVMSVKVDGVVKAQSNNVFSLGGTWDRQTGLLRRLPTIP